MNDLSTALASAGILGLLMLGVWLIVTIIIIKILTIIITNTVLDVIEKRKRNNNINWWR